MKRWVDGPEGVATRCDGVVLRHESNNVTVDVPSGLTESIVLALFKAVDRWNGTVLMDQRALNKVDWTTKLFNIPGDIPNAQRVVDKAVPLQPVKQIVAREFPGQRIEQLQSLRREGWTFLHVSCVGVVMSTLSINGTKNIMGYNVIAEREELVPFDEGCLK